MKAVHVFLAVDMRCGHDGLYLLAKSHGVDISKLGTENACVFISRDRLKMKTFSWNGVVCSIKSKDNKRPYDISALDEIAKAFDKNGAIDYPKALRARLEKVMASKGRLVEGEL